MLIDKPVLCPVLIGRESDLQVLDRLMLQAVERDGQVALIAGEAGIGKSRLVREFKARAPQGARILQGGCYQTDSALPYSPLIDLFRNFLATHSQEEVLRVLEPSAPQLVGFWRTYYGPTLKAFAALEPEKQAALRQDLESLWTQHNTAGDATTSVGAEYLEVIAIRQ